MKIKAFCLLAVIILFTSCGNNTISNNGENGAFTDTKELIGTFVKITAHGEHAEAAVNVAFERAFQLEMILSLTKQDSEINRINETAFNEPQKVSKVLLSAVKRGLYYSELSHNALDISAGRLIDLWGIGTENANIPNQDEIDILKGTNSVRDVVLDEENSTIIFKSDKTKLNLGAVGKGYFADEIKRVLTENGISSALINLGGNVKTIGSKQSGSGWVVGIADPFEPDKLMGSVTVKGYSVVTSGDYEKYFEENGVRYHHIMDTAVGYPAESDISGVTIIGESSTDCDALSTAAFVMGSEKAFSFIESLDGFEAVIIKQSGEIVTTSGISEFSFKKNK